MAKQNENQAQRAFPPTWPIRKSSGAVVWRLDAFDRLEVLLVKSTSGKSWCHPKGGIESHLSSRTSAIKEVYEEAGVIGHLGETLMRYEYLKEGVMQHVTLYEMELSVELETYPEAAIRKRKWFPIGEAYPKLSKDLQRGLDELEEYLLDRGIEVNRGA